jgi:hypothetical protein
MDNNEKQQTDEEFMAPWDENEPVTASETTEEDLEQVRMAAERAGIHLGV